MNKNKKLIKNIRLHPANRAYHENNVRILKDNGIWYWPDADLTFTKEEIIKCLKEA